MIIGHIKQVTLLTKSFKEKTFAHAYLFTGAPQLGKKAIAKELIKLINCKEKNVPCQICQSCIAIEKEQYPDLLVVKSIDSTSSVKDGVDNREIDIKQIRNAQNFLAYKPYYAFAKSVIIDDADRMNLEAQNCFLKSLEEPKGDAIIFLVTSKPELLLKTIFSRCQTVKFYPVLERQIKDSLKGMKIDEQSSGIISGISLGRPGRAIELMNDKEKMKREEVFSKEVIKTINANLAEKFQYVKSLDLEKTDIQDLLGIIQAYLRYQLFSSLGFTVSKADEHLFSEVKNIKKHSTSDLQRAIHLSEELTNTLAFTNANKKMALEVLLMEI